MSLPDARIADDSDSQRALRVVVARRSPAGRYWEAIDPAERDRIADAVPAGCRLLIATGLRAKPGTVTVSLRDERNSDVVEPRRGYLNAALCWSVLPRVVVTTDAGGWVEDIEEVA